MSSNSSFIEIALGLNLEMIEIPEGYFMMGSPEDTSSQYKSDEKPQHKVSMSAFFMGKHHVTKFQWSTLVKVTSPIQYALELSPEPVGEQSHPVVCINWWEAVEFCNRLSVTTGRNYRLPTEAEWEYACRAGTDTMFSLGDDIAPDLANCFFEIPGATVGLSEVCSFPPNAWGLCDMHGNAWEWCLDCWHDNYRGAPTDGSAWDFGGDRNLRILRGGSWINNPRFCRSAARSLSEPDDRNDNIGFRVVCEI